MSFIILDILHNVATVVMALYCGLLYFFEEIVIYMSILIFIRGLEF
jgi:hypothetical protein